MRTAMIWICAALAGFVASAASAALPAWVQLTGEGAEVRTLASDDHCPPVSVDGRSVEMELRAPADAAFPGVCRLKLSDRVRRVAIRGIALPPPPSRPRRIVVFGDSGCRLKGALVQDCNDPRAWPFAQVARIAAARRPDLVIHVGDYYYRETPCPALDRGCAGSPSGDRWDTWNSEFFAPAKPLLARAPWVFVRGNHESCQRGGPGWFHLLDAAERPKPCPASSDPFLVSLGDLRLYVLDSADAEDRSAPPEAVSAFSSQLAAVAPPAQGEAPAWILTHRPIWGLVPVVRLGSIGPLSVAINATEQAAARSHDLGGVQMIVSGHIHHFASFDFGGARPAQLIVGTAGDVGEPADTPRIQTEHVNVDGLAADRLTFDRFGYLVLDRRGDGVAVSDWAGVFYDVQDHPVARCRLHDRSLKCVATRR